jgi:ATPase subunit of ABC transporter with duplicated ATPase domains
VRKRAKKVARRAVTLKARLERQAESVGHVERPEKAVHGLEGNFAGGERSTAILVSATGVALEVAGRRLVDGVSFDIRRGERVALIGDNGSGKTTLVRTILGQAQVAAGRLTLAGSARTGYLAQEDDIAANPAYTSLTAVEFLRRHRPMPEAEAFNYLHRFLFGHGLLRTPLGAMSYGERRRLALAVLVLGGANLLLLDEPTNHLDLPSREAFEAAFASYDGAALVVTHDRYFIERFATRVLALEGGRLLEV